MITLHGIWLPDAFFLFGRRGQQYTDVTEWIDSLVLPENIDVLERGKVGVRSFMLPLYIPKEDQLVKKPGLLLQNVKGVAFDLRDAFPLFQWIEPVDGMLGEIRIADDFLYWQKAFRFTLELILRGRYYPLLEITKKGHSYGKSEGVAKWEPSFEEGPDRQRFHLFIQTMPPICRAYDSMREKGWVDTEPKEILLSFIREVIGVLLQEWVGDHQWDYDASAARGNIPLVMNWLKALTAKTWQRKLTAKTTDLVKLASDITDWVQKKEGKNPGLGMYPLRLFFRLEPPQAQHPEQLWTLSFFLQPLNAPTELLSASDLWSSSLERLPALHNRRLSREEAAEMLLVQLARAAKVVPLLWQVLKHPRPLELVMDVKSAYHFLRESAEQLQAEGFGLQLPAWWTQRERKRLGIKLQVQPLATALGANERNSLGLHQLVEFDARAALGNETLTFEELKRLAEQQVPLFPFRGEWAEVDRDELRKVLDYVTDSTKKHMSLGELFHLMAEHTPLDGLEDVPVVDFSLPKELSRIIDGQMEINVHSRSVPQTLQGTLRPYQQRGYAWLAAMSELGFGVCLADDMGLGKTVQLITLLLATPLKPPALVVCPTSLLTNWQRELNRFAPALNIYVHHGSGRLHAEEFLATVQKYDCIITSYSLVSRDYADFAQVDWSYLVADEAQYVKNSNTKQAKSLMSLKAAHRIALTGTPVENRLQELWSLFQFLNPGYLGSQRQFQSSFVLPIEREQDQERAETLHKLVKPFILRRVKKDPSIMQELPEKIEMKTFCPLTPEQAGLYKATVDEMMKQIESTEGIKRKGLVLASLTSLKQICDHPALFLKDANVQSERSGKMQRLLEIIQQIRAQNEAAVIFTQYVQMGMILQRCLTDEQNRPLFLHGGVKKQERDKLIDAFAAEDGPNIFILSLRAGGVGLNLTRANHVIHFDRWWNPAVENQATDRVFRLGQKKNVQVHSFICKGTLEERIDNLMESKKDLADKIIHAGEAWLTELSVDELTSLFTLREDALENDEEGF